MSDIEMTSDSAWETSEESSSEEEFIREKRTRNENYLDETVTQYDDAEFKDHFRVSKEVARDVCEHFKNSDYFKRQSGDENDLEERNIEDRNDGDEERYGNGNAVRDHVANHLLNL
ncbi:hypothetical protein QE152_g10491 [Popillia japonica]|uniref:Uncharacterized protein n=1 Tax=Popillia japonica TaxID=7064 RepID=A0AAW1LVF9_POPJA